MRQLTIGDVTITSIIERDGPWRKPEDMFPAYDAEVGRRHLAALDKEVFDPVSGKMVITYQTYVVRTPKHTILIDTCTGEDKGYPPPMDFPKQPWLDGFHAAGLRFEDIDYVFCTHLHIDHTGWNTMLRNGRWVPTFPKARYVFADRELDYWTKRQQDDPAACPWITDSVLPIVAANRVDIVKSAYAFNDLMTLIPTPGHTIDHYSVHVGKQGADAVITGDMIHSPLQARYPEFGMMSDYDSALAGKSRRELFGRFCDTSTLMCTAHFPSPSTARVVRWKDAFDLVDA